MNSSSTFHSTCLANKDTIDGLSIHELYDVEVKPKFKGGDVDVHKYLLEHIEYTEENLNEGIQTYFQVCFVIDTIGLVRNVCILNPLNNESYTGIEKELIKVIEKMPKWNPAMKDGIKVPCIYRLSMNIDIN